MKTPPNSTGSTNGTSANRRCGMSNGCGNWPASVAVDLHLGKAHLEPSRPAPSFVAAVKRAKLRIAFQENGHAPILGARKPCSHQHLIHPSAWRWGEARVSYRGLSYI